MYHGERFFRESQWGMTCYNVYVLCSCILLHCCPCISSGCPTFQLNIDTLNVYISNSMTRIINKTGRMLIPVFYSQQWFLDKYCKSEVNVCCCYQTINPLVPFFMWYLCDLLEKLDGVRSYGKRKHSEEDDMPAQSMEEYFNLNDINQGPMMPGAKRVCFIFILFISF